MEVRWKVACDLRALPEHVNGSRESCLSGLKKQINVIQIVHGLDKCIHDRTDDVHTRENNTTARPDFTPESFHGSRVRTSAAEIGDYPHPTDSCRYRRCPAVTSAIIRAIVFAPHRPALLQLRRKPLVHTRL